MPVQATHITLAQRLARIWFFFPVQLLVLHVKKNHFLLFFWLLLFGYTTGVLGGKYGVDHQFLFPEYFGRNSPMAFFILGFTLGGFVLAFNLYSYILHGFRFPFIATLNRPFLKFTYNNFIIPVAFVITWCAQSYRLQMEEELVSVPEAMANIAGMLLGLLIFSFLMLLYFGLTNQSAPKLSRKMGHATEGENLVTATLHKRGNWYPSDRRSRIWRVETYLSNPFSVKLARPTVHYDRALLERVFSQNHINASILEVVLIATFVLIGAFGRNDFFIIPAAASVFIFFSMLLMLVSALFSWVRGWTFSLLVGLLVLINFTYDDYSLFNRPSRAYGMDYSEEPATYDRTYIYRQNFQDSLAFADMRHGLEMLEHWKARQGVEKPPLVLVQCSGGGSRSALWSYATLSRMDSLLDGGLMKHAFMITGSSGGMLGAAYFRELKMREAAGERVNPWAEKHQDAISRDLLNPLIFSMATNDCFIRFRSYAYENQRYTLDRGSMFEDRLHKNTGFVLEKSLGAYAEAEYWAEIPWMVLSPTITRDGRRLIISSQPAAYLTQNESANVKGSNAVPEDVEYLRLFERHDPLNLRFSSALRMNATFPYVLPPVSLPSEPPVEVMDAGMRDNFGMKTTLQMLFTYREWIQNNCREVIILQVRDLQKDFSTAASGQTLVGQFTAPLGAVYGNFTRMQDFGHDEHLRYLEGWLDKPVTVVMFSLYQDPEEKISLSWHLTQAEKMRIRRAVNAADFTEPFNRFRQALNTDLVDRWPRGAAHR